MSQKDTNTYNFAEPVTDTVTVVNVSTWKTVECFIVAHRSSDVQNYMIVRLDTRSLLYRVYLYSV